MPNPTPQGHRKTFAIKHSDGEPLTRVDLQYDLLHHIFSNTQAVFTDPYKTLNGGPPGSKVTFRDLYVNALVHSPRCSKACREKILDTPQFGDEFAMISLLSNVGRINTTMAFFPEMRTALRTYHPVPSLQKTDGNLQDAPRIKNILKSCQLEHESQGVIMSPSDVLSRSRSGQVPGTSVVNVIFSFATYSQVIARTHFEPFTSFDFLDFFTPIKVSSKSRAHAILWLCYHYLEAPTVNPFSDEQANKNPGKIPALSVLTMEEAALENVDAPDEVEWGRKMLTQRKEFIEKAKDDELETKERGDTAVKRKGGGTRGRKKGKALDRSTASSIARDRHSSPSESQASIPSFFKHEDGLEGPGQASSFRSSPPPRSPSEDARDPSPDPPQRPLREYVSDPLLSPRAAAAPYPRRPAGSLEMQASHGKPIRTRSRRVREYSMPHVVLPPPPLPYPRTAHYTQGHAARPYTIPRAAPPPVPKRTMLQQAWHVVMTTDPLVDSDEETADENARLDYILRLRIINRLRGKEPTPEPQFAQHLPQSEL